MVIGLGPVSDCTENYRSVLSTERAPLFNNQANVRLKKRKGKIWSKEGARQTAVNVIISPLAVHINSFKKLLAPYKNATRHILSSIKRHCKLSEETASINGMIS
jgi:hypothetical protein